jgi:hypothetical protein
MRSAKLQVPRMLEGQMFLLLKLKVVRSLKEQSIGDMFLRAIEDYAGTDNEIENIARGHKSKLLKYFQELAQRIGIDNERDLASQFTLLLEGTTSMTTLIGAEKATEHSIVIART